VLEPIFNYGLRITLDPADSGIDAVRDSSLGLRAVALD
jgi:hypothetical protein